MWSDKRQDKGRASGAYNLRDVLQQVSSAEARQDGTERPATTSAASPPPMPTDPGARHRSGAPATGSQPDSAKRPDGTSPRHDLPLLPPKGITYAATGALVSIAAIVLSQVPAPPKPPAAVARRISTLAMAPQPLPSREVASGQLVMTLASLSKSVLAGATQLPPPEAPGLAPEGPPLLLSDVVHVRASNVVTGNSGLEASWPIEVVTNGIALPNGKVLIDGLPAAAKLNRGWLRTDGRWSVAPADLAGLTVTVPAAFARAEVTVSLVNDNDIVIAHSEAIVEPVPQPEAATAPARAEATLEDQFNAFVDKWKRYKGRDHMTDAERAALFAEYRSIAGAADGKGR